MTSGTPQASCPQCGSPSVQAVPIEKKKLGEAVRAATVNTEKLPANPVLVRLAMQWWVGAVFPVLLAGGASQRNPVEQQALVLVRASHKSCCYVSGGPLERLGWPTVLVRVAGPLSDFASCAPPASTGDGLASHRRTQLGSTYRRDRSWPEVVERLGGGREAGAGYAGRTATQMTRSSGRCGRGLSAPWLAGAATSGPRAGRRYIGWPVVFSVNKS